MIQGIHVRMEEGGSQTPCWRRELATDMESGTMCYNVLLGYNCGY